MSPDSIYSEITQTTDPIVRIDKMLDHAFEIRVSNIQRSIELAEEAASLSDENNYARGVATSHSHLGLFHMITGNNAEGLNKSELALSYFEAIDDKKGMASALYNIGSCLLYTSPSPRDS